MRTFALVPAAGHSRRMGRPKLSLPLGESTVIACVVAALKQGGVDDILVVIGPHVPELKTLARSAGASVLGLATETPDMRATVELGLDWLESHRQPNPDDNWLLCPADHPTLEPEVVQQLIQSRRDQPGHALIIPSFQGRRGHPPLLAWSLVGEIRAWPRDQGLNTYFRAKESVTRLLAVNSETVLRDLDTPEDYGRISAPRSPFAS